MLACLANDHQNLVCMHSLDQLIPQQEDGQRLPLVLDGPDILHAQGGSFAHGFLLPFRNFRRREVGPPQALG